MHWEKVVAMIFVKTILKKAECIWVNPVDFDTRISKFLCVLNFLINILKEISCHQVLVLDALWIFVAWIESYIHGNNTLMMAYALGQSLKSIVTDLVLLEANGFNVLISMKCFTELLSKVITETVP